jgi:hypothetical protein
VDYDSDGFYEIRTGLNGESYGFFGAVGQAGLAVQETIDQTAIPGGITNWNNLTAYTQFTGDASIAYIRNGIFSVMRYGSAGVGGGVAGAAGTGTDIAAGFYNEYRGNGNVTGPSIACEAYTSIYSGQPVNYIFGTYGAVQVDNATIGGTATISGDGVGATGVAKTVAGSNSTWATKAIGLQGTTSFAGSGTVADAISCYLTAGKTGATTITTSYGLLVQAISTGNTNNYGVYIGGASGGSTDNYALRVASGKVVFNETAANSFLVKTSQIVLGDGTDRNTVFTYEQLTATDLTPQMVYKGSDGASSSFEFTRPIRNVSPQGALWTRGRSEELITLSTIGTTTDSSANLLPANSIIEAVLARIVTTIATATDWKVGDPTQATRFIAVNATLTSGTTAIGLLHADPTVATANLGPVQTSAAKVRITTTGTPSAGAIRITTFYRTFIAATA